ncbi:hypothetical protein GCM10020254_79680 [Streptomyces goshikiensis]
MGPANAAGPAPVDLGAPPLTDAADIAERLAAGEWVVDLRNRIAFADGHVAGSFNFEADGKIATYLAWMIPRGKPLTLLADSPAQLAAAQRELVRVGIDRPAAAATGTPRDWLADGHAPRSFPRATFADLAARASGSEAVVLDVRRNSERAKGWIAGSVHIPVHDLHRRPAEVPPGTVWVHCAGGMRAGIAASLLDAAGRDVVAVDDSFDAASRAGLPPPTAADHHPSPKNWKEARCSSSVAAHPASRLPRPASAPPTVTPSSSTCASSPSGTPDTLPAPSTPRCPASSPALPCPRPRRTGRSW